MPQIASLIKKYLPFQPQLRILKRAFIPYRSNPDNDEGLLVQALTMVDALSSVGATLKSSSVVEIGTGWIPILPLVFRMAGADEVTTVDQERLMDSATFSHALEYVRLNLDRLQEHIGSSHVFDRSQLPRPAGRALNDLLQISSICYRAPDDFLNLSPQSADLIVSRTVLEHIPEQSLVEIFQHAASILRPGGLMCHIIDMSDHFEHKNKSLSRLDMLRHSDGEWASRTKDPQDYQNRLRRFEFLEMLENTGWQVIKATSETTEQALRDLATMTIIPRYANVPHDELAILTSMIIAKRRETASNKSGEG